MLALAIAISIVLLIILALSLPLDLTFDFDIRGEIRSRVKIGFFGLISREIEARRREINANRQQTVKPLLTLVREQGIPVRLQHFFRRIPRCVKVRQLDMDVRFGMEDPIDTGMLCAMLWPVLSAFGPGPMRVRVEPSFSKPALEGAMSGTIRVTPIKVVGAVSMLAFSRTGFRTARTAVTVLKHRT